MAFNSTIKRKKCKCSKVCDKWPTLGWNGYFLQHATQELKDKKGTKAKQAARNKANKNALSRKVHIAQKVVDNEGLTEKERWFRNRREEMTGVCLFCAGKTEKFNDKTFRNSIAHLLEKKNNFGGFPSVALHEDNWLELCYYGNSCHDNFDRHMITLELLRDSDEWDIIVSKFKKIYPFISITERRNIHELLLKEV